MPDETTARDVAVVVVPVIREPEKLTVVQRVAGVHSIYGIADDCKPVARVRRQPRPGVFTRLALRLAGLPFHSCLRENSPGKALAATRGTQYG